MMVVTNMTELVMSGVMASATPAEMLSQPVKSSTFNRSWIMTSREPVGGNPLISYSLHKGYSG